jgi:hypothetical protein
LAKKANRQNPVDPRLGEVCLGHERLGKFIEMYGVRTFLQAYENKTLRPLVQKMISDAKKRVIHLR